MVTTEGMSRSFPLLLLPGLLVAVVAATAVLIVLWWVLPLGEFRTPTAAIVIIAPSSSFCCCSDRESNIAVTAAIDRLRTMFVLPRLLEPAERADEDTAFLAVLGSAGYNGTSAAVPPVLSAASCTSFIGVLGDATVTSASVTCDSRPLHDEETASCDDAVGTLDDCASASDVCVGGEAPPILRRVALVAFGRYDPLFRLLAAVLRTDGSSSLITDNEDEDEDENEGSKGAMAEVALVQLLLSGFVRLRVSVSVSGFNISRLRLMRGEVSIISSSVQGYTASI